MSRWFENPRVLLQAPYTLIPSCSMTTVQYDNTIAKLLLVAASVFYFKAPGTPWWRYCLMALAALVLFQKTVSGAKEMLGISQQTADDVTAQLLEGPKQATPVTHSPFDEDEMTAKEDAQNSERARQRAVARAKEVQQELQDRRQMAQQMTTNVREMAGIRGEIIPSEEERIFSTRHSLSNPKDGIAKMFTDTPGDMTKFLYLPHA